MEFVGLLAHYVAWHYSRAIKDMFGIWRNFLWFLYHFFSIPVITKTFFAPWKRLAEEYKKGFAIKAFFSSLLINITMRLVGILLRTLLLLIAFVSMFFLFVAGFAVLVAWLFIPFFMLYVLVTGFKELVTFA